MRFPSPVGALDRPTRSRVQVFERDFGNNQRVVT
jgi:hypothetical protein